MKAAPAERPGPAASWAGLGDTLLLALAPLVALGFTRFAYALLLPGMQQSLGWTLAQAGALNTANAVGYLAGALAAPWLARRWGLRRCFGVSLWVSAAALLASAAPSDWHVFLVVRALGGVATSVAFVLGTALAPRAMPQRPATAMAMYFAGSGAGMLLAALLAVNGLEGDGDAWRQAWLAIGALAAAAAWAGAKGAARLPASAKAQGAGGAPRDWVRFLAPTLLANALYGMGYVGYSTFIIALLREQGYGSHAAAVFFGALGVASMLACGGWGGWLARQRGGRGFAGVSACVALGIVPVLCSGSLPALAVSALVFGTSFMAGPAAVSVVAQRALPPTLLASGAGALTALFSLGQAAGPVLTGWIADTAGSLSVALWSGPVLLVLGAGVAWYQREGRAV